jgi:hypothetical protein
MTNAWICPSCAHFTVRPAVPMASPAHDCERAGEPVQLIPYVDSTQAQQIRDRVDTPAGISTATRSTR